MTVTPPHPMSSAKVDGEMEGGGGGGPGGAGGNVADTKGEIEGGPIGGPRPPPHQYTYAVVGGGIAGVSCVEQILEYEPSANILLICSSAVVKEAAQITRLSKTLEDFIVVEKSLKSFKDVHQSVRVVQGEVSELLPEHHIVKTKAGETFSYRKLCICTGASPRAPFPTWDWEHIAVIRDTESVQDLTQKVSKARRILVLGNGGIATEYEVDGVDILWAIKDKSISAHFVDPGAAEFFIQSKLANSNEQSSTTTSSYLNQAEHESIPVDKTDDGDIGVASGEEISKGDTPQSTGRNPSVPSKRRKYTLLTVPSSSAKDQQDATEAEGATNYGSALGPDWHQGCSLKGQLLGSKNVDIMYETECCSVRKKETSDTDDFPVYATFTNGKTVGVDLIVCATGVLPNCSLFSCCEQDPEKGIFVNTAMKTSAPDVFAAGDVCYPNWPWSKHWFQMRLWTQARHMGLYAGKSMYLSVFNEDNPSEAEDIDLDFCFESFSHVTRFFGFKVVLLGLYNGQGLHKSRQQLLIRCTKNMEYLKLVLEDGRMQGAILIGETSLEETFENLILNQVDVSPFGEDLLNPDIDIEDYFD